jgi:hypothetical protein
MKFNRKFEEEAIHSDNIPKIIKHEEIPPQKVENKTQTELRKHDHAISLYEDLEEIVL